MVYTIARCVTDWLGGARGLVSVPRRRNPANRSLYRPEAEPRSHLDRCSRLTS